MVRSLLFSTAAVAALGLGCGQAAATEGSGRRPNIVFFLADDHTTQAISCYGSKLTTTPHIDRIATGHGDGPPLKTELARLRKELGDTQD